MSFRRSRAPRRAVLSSDPIGARDSRRMANSYAGGSIFIYQLIMGLALTNAAVVFFTSGSTGLRPIAAYNPVEAVLFIILVAFAIIRIFEYTAGMAFNIKYLYPKKGGSLFFVTDTFIGVLEALLFYVLSVALHDLPGAFLGYFYLVAAIYAVDIVSEVLGIVIIRNIDRRTSLALLFNFLTICIGATFVVAKPSFILSALIAVFIIRVFADYATAYTRVVTSAGLSD